MSYQSLTEQKTLLVSCGISNKTRPTNNQIQLNIVNKIKSELSIEDPTVYLSVFSKTDVPKDTFESSDISHIQQFDIVIDKNQQVSQDQIQSTIKESLGKIGFTSTEVNVKQKETYTIG